MRGMRVAGLEDAPNCSETNPSPPLRTSWNPFRACGARAGGGKGRRRRRYIRRRWRQQSRMLPSHLIGRSPMSSTHPTRAQLTAAHSRHQIDRQTDNAAPHYKRRIAGDLPPPRPDRIRWPLHLFVQGSWPVAAPRAKTASQALDWLDAPGVVFPLP